MYIITRFISIIISLFLFVSSAVNPTVKYEQLDSESIKLSAVILSDIHMESNNADRFGWIAGTLKGALDTEKQPDVLAFAGDNTMNGQSVEWLDFYSFVNGFNKQSKVLVAFGNHDFGNVSDHETYKKLSKRSIASYNQYCGENIDKVYYSREINGYKFIILGSEDNAENTLSVITDTQVDWLKGQLEEAAKKNMPAFVVNHNIIAGKNGDRSTWGFNLTTNNEKLAEALESCGTKVVYFSGHSHVALGKDSVKTFGNCTYVNLPCASGFDSYDGASPDSNSYGTGCCLEVYESSIVLRFRCFGENKWIEGYDNIVIDL